MPQSAVTAAFDPALSSPAAVASRLSASAQYQVVGYGELRTWTGPAPGERILLAASRGAPRAGDPLTLRLVLPAQAAQTSLSWTWEGIEPLETPPSRAEAGVVRIRVQALRARGRRVRVRLGTSGTLELALVDS